eukprot:TRINITY_DN17957_c0_g1_i1.p1 TRINITY_DN17957_c0_g1~~TRINITY_DN17957_c0_g1_i1.p1  ORF type:complete len:112 (-),score=26.57 TRINITY_DN17957_c0_g1_i1:31-366(-)
MELLTSEEEAAKKIQQLAEIENERRENKRKDKKRAERKLKERRTRLLNSYKADLLFESLDRDSDGDRSEDSYSPPKIEDSIPDKTGGFLSFITFALSSRLVLPTLNLKPTH